MSWGSRAGFDRLQEIENAKGSGKGSKLSALARRVFRREATQPSMFAGMMSSLGIVQDRISRSRPGHMGLFEFDRANEIIAAGEAAVELVLQVAMHAHRLHNPIPVRVRS